MGTITFAADVLPTVMVIVVGIIISVQAWMLRQIIALLKWQSMAEERCNQHRTRDENLEQQVPVTLRVLSDHSSEMETIRASMLNLEQRMVDGLKSIDKRLESIERKYDTAMSLIADRHQAG